MIYYTSDILISNADFNAETSISRDTDPLENPGDLMAAARYLYWDHVMNTWTISPKPGDFRVEDMRRSVLQLLVRC